MNFLPQVLIKITKNEFAENFLDGNLYMNNLETFCGLEKNEVGDRCEASAIIYKRFFNIIDVGNLGKPVFCMYGEKKLAKNNIIQLSDDRFRSFGDTCVVIYKTRSFIHRTKEIGLKFDNINYVKLSADAFTIKRPIFDKPIYFEYQKEFRLCDRNAYAKHFERFDDRLEYARIYGDKFADTDFYDKNKLGSLRDIALKVPIDELYAGLSLSKLA